MEFTVSQNGLNQTKHKCSRKNSNVYSEF